MEIVRICYIKHTLCLILITALSYGIIVVNTRALRIVLHDDKCTYHDLLRISQNICLFSMRREMHIEECF